MPSLHWEPWLFLTSLGGGVFIPVLLKSKLLASLTTSGLSVSVDIKSPLRLQTVAPPRANPEYKSGDPLQLTRGYLIYDKTVNLSQTAMIGLATPVSHKYPNTYLVLHVEGYCALQVPWHAPYINAHSCYLCPSLSLS